MKKLEAKGVPVLAVDGGGLPTDPDRASTLVQAMSSLGYKAMALEEPDMRIVPVVRPIAERNGMALLAWPMPNVPESTGLQGDLVLKVGSARVAVVSEGGGSRNDRTASVADARMAALQRARKEADLVVYVTRRPRAEVLQMVAQMDGQADIVIRADTIAIDELAGEHIGKTLIVSAAPRAQWLGVVRVKFQGKKVAELVDESVALDSAVPDEPDMLAFVTQQRRAASQSIRRVTATTSLVGTTECKTCHAGQVEKWRTTRHAHALESLKETEFIDECLVCHSTSFRHRQVLAINGPFVGVECVTCHLGAQQHARDPKLPANLKPLPAAMCMQCHNEKHDPKFDFKTYWPQIAH